MTTDTVQKKKGEDMIWIIVLSVLIAVIITIIIITAIRAKNTESQVYGTNSQNDDYFQEEEEPDCCKNCDYSEEKENNRIWCNERNYYVSPNTICPNYNGVFKKMAKEIAKWELEKMEKETNN